MTTTNNNNHTTTTTTSSRAASPPGSRRRTKTKSFVFTVFTVYAAVAVAAILPAAAAFTTNNNKNNPVVVSGGGVVASATALSVFGRGRGGSKKKASSSSSPLLEEALEAYPFGFEGKRAMVDEAKATIAFNELARLYGDEEALAMVRIFPRSLVFDSTNYGPCLDAWEEQFGLEAAQKMVGRNPGLLGVKPFTAKEPAEASMAFSYVIAVTRPLPKIIAVALLLSIATAGFGG